MRVNTDFGTHLRCFGVATRSEVLKHGVTATCNTGTCSEAGNDTPAFSRGFCGSGALEWHGWVLCSGSHRLPSWDQWGSVPTRDLTGDGSASRLLLAVTGLRARGCCWLLAGGALSSQRPSAAPPTAHVASLFTPSETPGRDGV